MEVCKQGVGGVCWCTFSCRSLVSEGRRRSVTRAATYVAESYHALDTNLYSCASQNSTTNNMSLSGKIHDLL